VLTSTGWTRADGLRVGDNVFRALERRECGPGRGSNEYLDNGPSSFEQILDSLAAIGRRARIPATTDYLHGDGRYCKGEIDVVIADHSLSTVLDSELVEQCPEGHLVRADVQAAALPSHSPGNLGDLRVAAMSVARPLTECNTSPFETPPERRAADSEDPGEVLAGLPCSISPDQIVNVDRGSFKGHAFDLQTSTGAYSVNGLIVHNCRHTVTACLARNKILPAPPPDMDRYKDEQRLRYLERRVREARRKEAVALDAAALRKARVELRAAWAAIREHVNDTGIARKRAREQILRAR
jgi:hypothetical protein